MFGFGSKKTRIATPVSGHIISITDVKDDVFAKKMLGDGFAVVPDATTVISPCNGTVLMLADTGHAIAIETEGVQFLIHIGINTVDLQGKGFTSHVKQGDSIKKGDPLITFDKAFIEAQGKASDVIVVFTNLDEIKGEFHLQMDDAEETVLIKHT